MAGVLLFTVAVAMVMGGWRHGGSHSSLLVSNFIELFE